MNRNQPAHLKGGVWGYWAGGVFCLLGIFALSLGVNNLITAAREKLKMVEVPGRSEIQFKIPGTYVAVCISKDAGREVMQRIQELEYFMKDLNETENVPVDKIPQRAYFSEKEERQIPLFQFVITKEGKYVLISNYPYEMEGPKVQAALFPTDRRYVWMEVIVGAALFIAFGLLGFFMIRKSYREGKPAALKSCPKSK